MKQLLATTLFATFTALIGCAGEGKIDVKKIRDDKLSNIANDMSLTDEAAIVAVAKELLFGNPMNSDGSVRYSVVHLDPTPLPTSTPVTPPKPKLAEDLPKSGYCLELVYEQDYGDRSMLNAEKDAVRGGAELTMRALRYLSSRHLTAVTYSIRRRVKGEHLERVTVFEVVATTDRLSELEKAVAEPEDGPTLNPRGDKLGDVWRVRTNVFRDKDVFKIP